MKKLVATMLILTCLVLTLAGCASSSADSKGGELVIFNYYEYLDESIISGFEDEYGIDILYEEYLTPESMYTKYKAGATDYDLICSSDYMLERLKNEGELLEIDYNNIPGFENIDPKYMEYSSTFDPDKKYTVPYIWGTLGLLYNKTTVDEADVHSWDVLFDDKYSGSIIMQNSMRDTFVPALKKLGYGINTTNENEIKEAYELLVEQKPKVQAYLQEEAKQELVAGNADIALVYSNEAYMVKEYSDDMAYSVPDEGSNLWIDSWVIPKTCKNKDAAEKFLDYLCRPEIAKITYDYMGYPPAMMKVDGNEYVDEAVLNDTTLYPPIETTEKCEPFRFLDNDSTMLYNDLWIQLKGNDDEDGEDAE